MHLLVPASRPSAQFSRKMFYSVLPIVWLGCLFWYCCMLAIVWHESLLVTSLANISFPFCSFVFFVLWFIFNYLICLFCFTSLFCSRDWSSKYWYDDARSILPMSSVSMLQVYIRSLNILSFFFRTWVDVLLSLPLHTWLPVLPAPLAEETVSSPL